MVIEIKKTRAKMIKPLYLGMSILNISKILMYKFWYEYIRPKYGDRAKLCYTDTDSFITYIKTENFFEDITSDVEKWYDTSNYDKNDKKSLPIDKNKKVPGLFKDELGGKIITEFVALRAKAYAYLDDDSNEHKKSKGIKRCVKNKNACFKISKIACLIIKLFIDRKKDLKIIIKTCAQKK